MTRPEANNADKYKLTEANNHLAMENSQLKEELAKLRILVEELWKGAIAQTQKEQPTMENCSSQKKTIDKKLVKSTEKTHCKEVTSSSRNRFQVLSTSLVDTEEPMDLNEKVNSESRTKDQTSPEDWPALLQSTSKTTKRIIREPQKHHITNRNPEKRQPTTREAANRKGPTAYNCTQLYSIKISRSSEALHKSIKLSNKKNQHKQAHPSTRSSDISENKRIAKSLRNKLLHIHSKRAKTTNVSVKRPRSWIKHPGNRERITWACTNETQNTKNIPV